MIEEVAAAVERVDDPLVGAAVVDETGLFGEQIMIGAAVFDEVDDDLVGLMVVRGRDLFGETAVAHR